MMKTVRLVADPYPPYQYLEGDSVRGCDQEIVGASFATQGMYVYTELREWNDCLRALNLGETDGIYQIAKTPERERIYLFSQPLRKAITVLFTNGMYTVDVKTGDGLQKILQGRPVGIVSGYSMGERIADMDDSMVIQDENPVALIKGLAQGKYDFALLDLGVGTYLARHLGIEHIRVVPGCKIDRKLYLAFRKDADDIRKEFNAGLRKVKEQGVYANILRKYGLVEQG
jgi:polar amino acid transport system substrate-binding protein